jgi:threonine/homoserine/homoserine lactone efflux protein
LETVGALLLFVFSSTISPGGATTIATASGVNFGFRRSLPVIVGISLGLASMAAAAAAGVASVFLAFPSLQLTVKLTGTAYLLWLAVQLGRTGPPRLGKAAAEPTSLFGGVGLVWYNPKGWAMTTGAAASFSAVAGNLPTVAVILGLAFGIFALFSLSVWCLGGQLLARILTRDWQWRALNIALAVLLVASIIPIWLD